MVVGGTDIVAVAAVAVTAVAAADDDDNEGIGGSYRGKRWRDGQEGRSNSSLQENLQN